MGNFHKKNCGDCGPDQERAQEAMAELRAVLVEIQVIVKRKVSVG